MDKTDITENNIEEVKEESAVETVEETAETVKEAAVETVEETVEEAEETVEETEEPVAEKPAEKVAPRRRRDFRQPSYRANREFGWESLDTVQDERKNELIQEIYDLSGDVAEEKIEEIQEEWEMLHDEGTDKRLESRFEQAIEIGRAHV